MIGPVRLKLGESPVWDDVHQLLLFCDAQQGSLHRWSPRTGKFESWNLSSEVASFALDRHGRVLLAGREGLHIFDLKDKRRHAVAPACDSQERLNDGKCDPLGRFWCGTVYEPRDEPKASLYCLGTAGTLSKHHPGATLINGLAWSPSGDTMYVADTVARKILAFDFDIWTGSISNARTFVSFDSATGPDAIDAPGRPDGATIDRAGNYWVAMIGGSCVLQISPNGKLLHRIDLPVSCPTMPCFGGEDLRTLYVTTAHFRHSGIFESKRPDWDGAVLQMTLDIGGLPAQRYCGADELSLAASG